MSAGPRETMFDPLPVQEHIARVKLETFCANVRAAYAERCVVMPPWRLWQFLHMAWQPYGLWTKAVNGQWTDQYRQNHDEEDINGNKRKAQQADSPAD